MSLRGLVKKVVFSGGGCGGFTLIEVLVALAVGSMVMVGATQVLQQIFVLVPKAETSMLAMRQAQFAGDWMVRDALAAQVITPADNITRNLCDNPSIKLVFTQVDWGSSNSTTTTYYVDAQRKLQREVKENSIVISNMQVADSITSLTALYMAPPGKDRRILTLTIVATVGGASESRTYQTAPRSY